MNSSLPFTSVISLHTNPMTCGVAKFSKLLADRLGVPFCGLHQFRSGGSALFSLKASEMSQDDVAVVMEHVESFSPRYGVFWHDAGVKMITDDASIVYYADPSLGPNGLWCPSLLTPSKPRTVKLFSFGFAHKLQTAHYAKVKALLDAAGLRYHLRVSVGLHEGTSLSDATQHFDALYEIMGRDNVTVLGILSDDAVVEELDRADYVLAFFEHGARANNTTLHAALNAGKRVITNRVNQTIWDDVIEVRFIEELEHWQQPMLYTWDHLIVQMELIYAKNTEARQPLYL